jgi:cytidine deaminase
VSHELPNGVERELARVAWDAGIQARVFGETKVGAAALDISGRIFTGCNVEHHFRSHDIHAEINAISSLVAGGGRKLVAIFIAARRERFTPCGGCLDWIFEVGGDDCLVHGQSDPEGPISRHAAVDLMPYYPR